MGTLGWLAAIVIVIWLIDRLLRGPAARLSDAAGAKKVGGAIHGFAESIPIFGGQPPFESGEAPPPAVIEPDLGEHRIEVEPPTRPTDVG